MAYTILETFSHQIMCLLLFGKETGFEFLFIPIIIIAMFIAGTYMEAFLNPIALKKMYMLIF